MDTTLRRLLATAARTAQRRGVGRPDWLAAIESALLGEPPPLPELRVGDLQEAWQHEETLGWAYQFYNSAVARAQARAASPAPRDAHELALRNQFFTPRYVGEFLLQNTLGVLLGVRGEYATHRTVPPSFWGEAMLPSGEIVPLPPPPRTVLDPACGAGHLLLLAFDMLVQHAQLAPQAALNRLWGVELDAALAAVARRALQLRAIRAGACNPVVQHILVVDDTLGVLRREWRMPQFDVVVMNPPFGAPVPSDKAYLAQHYPRSRHELACAFVERGFELLSPGGLVGALTTRTPFFLSSSQQWREEFVLQPPCQLTVFADLGAGVLDGAMVEVAAYCLWKRAGAMPAQTVGEIPVQAALFAKEEE